MKETELLFCHHCNSIQECVKLNLPDCWEWICYNCVRMVDSEFKNDDEYMDDYVIVEEET